MKNREISRDSSIKRITFLSANTFTSHNTILARPVSQPELPLDKLELISYSAILKEKSGSQTRAKQITGVFTGQLPEVGCSNKRGNEVGNSFISRRQLRKSGSA